MNTDVHARPAKTSNAGSDVVVVGSGAAGLVSALAAAKMGARVTVIEKSALIGGTSAISGGQIWIPCNEHMLLHGGQDTVADAVRYLRRVTLGSVPDSYIEAFVSYAPEMIGFVQENTRLELFSVKRPDYHPEWDGACDGRTLEPLPFRPRSATEAELVRKSRYRRPLTSVESRNPDAGVIAAQREVDGYFTQGVALVAALVEGCTAAGVKFQLNSRMIELQTEAGSISGVVYSPGVGDAVALRADSVVLASGGFEWNPALVRAFHGPVQQVPISPPSNEGDGLLAALRQGAAVSNMTESWWSAAVQVPGEMTDGKRAGRNIVRELALPGSLMVNAAGERFVNEASSYNDLGKAFLRFDTRSCDYPNEHAWLIFDAEFAERYAVVTKAPGKEAPDWFCVADSLQGLAARIGVEPQGLARSVHQMNGMAQSGLDVAYSRGASRHDQYYGDAREARNPCLGQIATAPFYAVPIALGNLGTKGGLVATINGEVLNTDANRIPGLFACGNVAASWMGLGYPGGGGSLGPIMTAAYLCGRQAAAPKAQHTSA